LIDETFYATLPKATLRLIKEEGQRAATIPIGIPFQINDSFTIEVENVKFIRDKVRAWKELTELTESSS